MHQCLRAETHGKTDDSSTGQQWLDVNSKIVQDGDDHKKDDGGQSEAPDYR